ncbi:MAG: hypothetical protein MO852_07585 [Candidatus Devosia euplotis]|nr:hypothetical protein [Candidatus Devosia euplotis]
MSSAAFSVPQMVAMPIPDCGVDQLKLDLMDRYNIDIPVFKWQDTCICRLSVQGYNSKPQMDLLIEAPTELLQLRAAPQPQMASQG